MKTTIKISILATLFIVGASIFLIGPFNGLGHKSRSDYSTPSSNNLLENGGFESFDDYQNYYPSPWEKDDCSFRSDWGYMIAPEGNRYLFIYNIYYGSCEISQEIGYVAEGKYGGKTWLRVIYGSANVRYTVNDGSSSFSSDWVTVGTNYDGEYFYIEPFYVAELTNANFYLEIDYSSHNFLYLDDILFEGQETNNDPMYPFPQNLHRTPPGWLSRPSMPIDDLNAIVQDTYTTWKTNYLKDRPNFEGQKIVEQYGSYEEPENGPEYDFVATSEGMGYGMLLTAIMGEEDNFNGLYETVKVCNSKLGVNLMSWVVPEATSSPLSDSATDGDLDIALALLIAGEQFSSITYTNAGKARARKIWEQNVHYKNTKWPWPGRPSIRTSLGDWHDQGDKYPTHSRVSDWMPQNFNVFDSKHIDGDWDGLDHSLTNHLMRSLQYQSTAGLVPDFMKGNSATPGSVTHAGENFLGEYKETDEYSFNACRFPMRLAMYLIGTSSSLHTGRLTPLINFYKGLGDPSNIGGTRNWEDGSSIEGGYLGSFCGPIVAGASVLSGNDQYVTDGTNLITSNFGQAYFEDTIAMLSLLVISGNWWTN